MNSKQYTFSDFSKKAVINVSDGRELGHVCDLIFNNCGTILAIIVPGKKSLFKSLTSSDNLIIPFNRIVKIGSDVILTDVIGNMATTCAAPPKPQPVYSQAARADISQDGERYSPPYREQKQSDFSAQAYSLAAEPMYRPDEQTPPARQAEESQAMSASPQTYYHAE